MPNWIEKIGNVLSVLLGILSIGLFTYVNTTPINDPYDSIYSISKIQGEWLWPLMASSFMLLAIFFVGMGFWGLIKTYVKEKRKEQMMKISWVAFKIVGPMILVTWVIFVFSFK